ncbi:Domain unknown function DUF295 [Dillenia turbinata]|uniref:KIB1-4 beta-propeller domain-containing protein n=1 Tax=Dillenia turbinata TaxID=194707 RepID=A0AAN8VCN4_9MAGN
MADWSHLLPELLIEISKKIDHIQDFVNFGCVCKPWLRAASAAKFNAKWRLPLLMLAEKEDAHVREFYDISLGGQIHRVDLPVARGSKIFPTLGWLVVVSETNADMMMLHPFLRRTINLPNPISLDEGLEVNGKTWLWWFDKAVLSADPCLSSDWVVLIVYGEGGKLAFARNGDKAWTKICVNERVSGGSDVHYYEGRIYAVDFHGRIVACDVQGPNPTVGQVISRIPANLEEGMVGFKFYLAEWCGKLVVIFRFPNIPRVAKFFRVFEIDFMDNGNWVEVTHIGNKAIFLGYNSSITVDALEFRKCKPNSLYFTDDVVDWHMDPRGGGRDMGIFNVADRSIEPYFEGESYYQITPPTWVQLNF